MIQPKYLIFALTLGLLAWLPHASAGGRGSAPSTAVASPPVIESVEVDHAQQRLTLTGQNLGNTAPQVMLGKYRLEVSASSPTQVVAKLPQGLRSATYRLLVNNAQSEVSIIYVQLQTASL